MCDRGRLEQAVVRRWNNGQIMNERFYYNADRVPQDDLDSTDRWAAEGVPMDIFDAICQRRAIKGFDPEQRTSSEQERTLLAAAIRASTNFNIQHWRRPKPGQRSLDAVVIDNGFVE